MVIQQDLAASFVDDQDATILKPVTRKVARDILSSGLGHGCSRDTGEEGGPDADDGEPFVAKVTVTLLPLVNKDLCRAKSVRKINHRLYSFTRTTVVCIQLRAVTQ